MCSDRLPFLVAAVACPQVPPLAQQRDLLDELNRVIPGAERRLRAWGIHR